MIKKFSNLRASGALLLALLLFVTTPASMVFALDTGFLPPSSNSLQGGKVKWTNPGNGYASDDLYATAAKNKWVAYGTLNFSIPAGSSIDGIEVRIEGKTTGQDIITDLTWNGGASFTSSKLADFTNGAPDADKTLGGPTDKWGRTWAVGDFSNANFRIRLKSTNVTGNFLLDQVRVKVYFTPPATKLSVTAVTGTYGNPVNLSAKFTTSGGAAISGKNISFTLNGSSACNGTTNANGVATCSAVLTTNVGNYPAGVGASFAGDAGYDAVAQTAALTVNPRALTIKANNASKTYGDTLLFAGTEFTATGLVGTDSVSSVTLVSSGSTPGAKVSGSPYTIVPSGATGTGLGNYNVSYSNGSLTVNRKALTVSGITASGKTYDGTTTATLVGSASLTGVVAPDVVILGGTPAAAFSDKNAGNDKAVNITGFTLSGTDIGNYTLTQPTALADIFPLPLTISDVTVNDKTYDGNTYAALNAGFASLVTPIDTDDVTLDSSSASAVFDNKNAGNNKAVIIFGFILTGIDAPNYSLSQPAGLTASISPLEITITAVSDTKVYNGDNNSSGIPIVSPSPLGGDTGNFSQSFNNRDAGTGKILIPSGIVDDGNGGANYAYSFVSVFDGEITPLPISVTARTDSKVYDGTTTSGVIPDVSPFLVGTDTANFLQLFDTNNVGTNITITPDGYVIDGNNGNNYTVTFYSVSTGQITPKTLTVTADHKAKLAGNQDPVFTFSVSGFIFPDSFTTEPTCGVSGPHSATGTYDIVCSGGDAGGNYSIDYGNGTLTVTDKIVLEVSTANQTITYGDPIPSFAPQYSGFQPDDDETDLFVQPACAASGPFTHVASPFVITCSGGSDETYEFNYTSGTLTVNALGITVAAEAKTKAYGDVDPAFTYTYTPDLVGSDAFGGKLLRSAGEDVGVHPINQGTLHLNGNYILNYVPSDLTITKATLTVTANDKTIWFSQPDPDFTYSYSGLKNGDTSAVIDISPTCGVSEDHTTPGAYPIDCSMAGDNNYDFSYVSGTLTVKAPLVARYYSIASQDGWIVESTETSGVGGTLNRTGSTLRLGDDASNRQYRSILSFDTSTLPDNAVIVSATLKFKYAGKAGTLPFGTHGSLLADVRNGIFGTNVGLQLADFRATSSKAKVLAYTSTKVDNWYSQLFNQVDFHFINLVSFTQFRLRFSKGDNNDRGADYLKIFSGNTLIKTDRPQLIIEYYVP